ncbi:hypothetical protein SPSYN_01932 [Sporotomaculum syntrophicum]|uniref:Uncharacterized protein n=1 Tax=Sporotomaculum syntrophicum TaxID=182264 RepID=A0A9D3AX86_9FIRM|nr:hypothetical protein [Sporotomaculum syntrophicum]KAF1084762.1 hypothetical protein SPSYN_01932 [Sporotomaculum syntrophicum]
MQAIKKRICLFACLTGVGLTVCVVIFMYDDSAHDLHAQILLAILLWASAISLGLWIHEFRKSKIARLIMENPILHIRTAVISGISGADMESKDIDNSEVFISYFGILLDSKIIKFNQDGIHLKAVEIGHSFISLTYGTEKWVQTTRLLREAIDKADLEEIYEKFRYETGIVPTFTETQGDGSCAKQRACHIVGANPTRKSLANYL